MYRSAIQINTNTFHKKSLWNPTLKRKCARSKNVQRKYNYANMFSFCTKIQNLMRLLLLLLKFCYGKYFLTLLIHFTKALLNLMSKLIRQMLLCPKDYDSLLQQTFLFFFFSLAKSEDFAFKNFSEFKEQQKNCLHWMANTVWKNRSCRMCVKFQVGLLNFIPSSMLGCGLNFIVSR